MYICLCVPVQLHLRSFHSCFRLQYVIENICCMIFSLCFRISRVLWDVWMHMTRTVQKVVPKCCKSYRKCPQRLQNGAQMAQNGALGAPWGALGASLGLSGRVLRILGTTGRFGAFPCHFGAIVSSILGLKMESKRSNITQKTMLFSGHVFFHRFGLER